MASILAGKPSSNRYAPDIVAGARAHRGARVHSARLRRVEAEVLVLAGRHDHTADYRVLIALAAHYPRGRLFIADDNHVFEAMNRQGHVTALMRAFLTEGMDSAAYRTAEATAGVLRWRE